MELSDEGLLLRVFIGESDHHEGQPLYEQIVREARERGLAGATVLRGQMGFGAASRIHTAKMLRLSEDLPVIVEIVDTKEQIEKMLPFLEETVDDGLVTLEQTHIVSYHHGKKQE